MKELSLIPNKKSTLTMTSREIADLVEARHDSVKRTIDRLVLRGVIVRPPLVDEPIADILGRPRTDSVYHIGKRDSYIIVAQLCPEFTARLVDRWQELEEKQQKPTALLPQNYAAALRELAESVEREEVLKIENKQQATAIESMNSYFRSGISPFEFVKGLNGVNSLKVGDFLVSRKWLYQDRSSKRVASYARDRYLTEENTEIKAHGRDPILAYKPVLLQKGAAKLYEWYVKGELPMKQNWNGEFTQNKAVGL
ncbi:Rha family transcriptional regulator [Pasteurella multocida subsp. multocida]|uniref:Rha family transcriptional regulator n=2 Tax=Pasteurella multocida TaxID=747 RepID=A0A9X3US48_PASMD|nr:Rha family transcriptional regulator [Pasteurella multocida]MDA5618720.1 Rha family transcriptional regulator [Pasteurella multocida subsp. multocida]MDA5620866.1 Rha family transcriptional regulator [Pasteurella multocida subsp. multocida]MDA5624338.1 Rha family transcriptional regulator [Pasteurella multocida]